MFDPKDSESTESTRSEEVDEKTPRRSTKLKLGKGVKGALAGFGIKNKVNPKVAEYIEFVEKALKESEDPIDLFHMPRGVNGVDYDTLVLIYANDGLVNYYTSVIADSNKRAMSADEIVDIIENNSQGVLLFPGVASNSNLEELIEEHIAENYTGDPISLEGLVTTTLTEEAAYDLVATATKNFAMADGIIDEADLTEQLGENKDLLNKIEITTVPGLVEVVEGDVRRCNALTTSFLTTKRSSKLANGDGMEIEMATTGTFVSTIPYKNQKEEGLVPEIIINYIHSDSPTFGITGAAIYNATLMGSQKAWLEILTQDVRNGKQVGLMETLLTDDNGEPRKGIIFSKKDSKRDIQHTLNDIIDDAPVYSMFVKSYYKGGSELSPFVALGMGDIAAGEFIIESYSKLTDGRFDNNFNPKDIISNITKIYGGTYPNKDGESMPTETIDLVDVLEKVQNNKSMDFGLVNDFAHIVYGNDTGAEVDKLKIFTTLGYTAMIETEMYKITFTQEFIDEIISAFSGTIYDGEVNTMFGVEISRNTLDFAGINRIVNSSRSSRHRDVQTRNGRNSRGRSSFSYKTNRRSSRR